MLSTLIKSMPGVRELILRLDRMDEAIHRIEETTRVAAPSFTVTANPEGWQHSQEYELNFWKNEWPYRDLPIEEIRKIRNDDARWFLSNMGFRQGDDDSYEGFSGRALEVGCGPIGYFEMLPGVSVTAVDSLMEAYATDLSYSLLGTRGSTTYVKMPVQDITEKFDFVICSNVLDHTSDWISFLNLCRGRIVDEGELLLFTHSRGYPVEGHTQVFSPPQLRTVLRMLGASDFVVDRTDRVSEEHRDFDNYIRARF